MPTGIIINTFAIAIGGVLGAVFADKVPTKVKSELTQIFGVCALGMGITSVILMKNMPAVIFSVVLGSAIGLWCNLGEWISRGASLMQKPVAKLAKNKNTAMSQDEYTALLVTIIVLFCASGSGIYGALDSGMSGDHTILISKSILDFFTALIFACNIGMAVPLVAVPQFIIFMIIFMLARFIYPLTTPAMIADFKACGGILLLATGFRIAGMKQFPTADMIPAMIIVMPVSRLWTDCIVPLFG